MRIRILGSAAGGGFPQWNCGCANCRGLREGKIRATARTQESVCFSDDDGGWFLINASPEIRTQIESFDGLHPRNSRDSPIQAIVLTNGDLDHCLGLLSLRENIPIVVYATDAVRQGFEEGNVLYRTLQRFSGQVTWRRLTLGVDAPLLRADGRPSGWMAMAVAVPGKPPVHLEGLAANHDEMNVGLRFTQLTTQRTLTYLSSVGRMTPSVEKVMAGTDCLMFDGTFWSNDELSAPGLMSKSAGDMAHWPVGGRDGSLAALAGITARRRLFIHMNNTNPMVREDSPERKQVEAAGWEVAYDGMEIML